MHSGRRRWLTRSTDSASIHKPQLACDAVERGMAAGLQLLGVVDSPRDGPVLRGTAPASARRPPQSSPGGAVRASVQQVLDSMTAPAVVYHAQQGLVDEVLVYVLPVLLGDGVRFSGLGRIDLDRSATRSPVP